MQIAITISANRGAWLPLWSLLEHRGAVCFVFFVFNNNQTAMLKIVFSMVENRGSLCCCDSRRPLGILENGTFSTHWKEMRREGRSLSLYPFCVWSLIGMFWAPQCRMMSAQGLTLKGLLHVCQRRARQGRPTPPPRLLHSVWIPVYRFVRTSDILCHSDYLQCFFFLSFVPFFSFFYCSGKTAMKQMKVEALDSHSLVLFEHFTVKLLGFFLHDVYVHKSCYKWQKHFLEIILTYSKSLLLGAWPIYLNIAIEIGNRILLKIAKWFLEVSV